MPSQFSSAKHSIAECDRCGFRFKLKQLKQIVIKTKNVNILVCPACWEPDHPQLQLGLYPVNDPQAVRNPRVDSSYYAPGNDGAGGSRDIQWGWNPVGGARSFDSKLTPNNLIAYSLLGTVIVDAPNAGPVPPISLTGMYVSTETGEYLSTESGDLIIN